MASTNLSSMAVPSIAHIRTLGVSHCLDDELSDRVRPLSHKEATRLASNTLSIGPSLNSAFCDLVPYNL